MRCENYWFRLDRPVKSTVQKLRLRQVKLEDVMTQIDCTKRATTLFTPKHPPYPEEKWSRPRWLCDQCLSDAKVQDELQRRLENGTLFDD